MLTAFQCEVVAYVSEGEYLCPDCVPTDQDCTDNEVIRYSLDEIQSQNNIEWKDQGEWPEGCTDDCEPFVESCGSCGTELGEPYHYGHAEDENVTEPSWTGNTTSYGIGLNES